MSSRNSRVKRKLRNKLKKRRRRCAFCGAADNLTLDHKIPLSRGGTWAQSNLQLLCAKCNVEKGDRMPWEIGDDAHGIV